MSSKKNKKKSVVTAVKVTQRSETDDRERAENEGMPARPSGVAALATPGTALEGEGSRTAARHYEAGLKASLALGQTEALAEKARRALEGPEAAALLEAESAARLGVAEKAAEARHP